MFESEDLQGRDEFGTNILNPRWGRGCYAAIAFGTHLGACSTRKPSERRCCTAAQIKERFMVRSAHLNPAMQAVDIYVDVDGQRVRAVIPREVLEQHFHAEGTPESWLRTAESKTGALTAVIRRRVHARPGDLVVVRSADFA